MLSWHKICCPIDFSSTSRDAAVTAAELALKLGTDLVLVHVHTLPVLATPDAFAGASTEATRSAVETITAELAAWKRDLEPLGVPQVTTAWVTGLESIPDQILAFAASNACDVVVMGTHGRSGLSHVLLGSVAELVVRRAHIPVITVRPSEKRIDARAVV
jgi:nucleotide-binding universal stress UspA family protein